MQPKHWQDELHRARVARGWTAQEVADRVGVSTAAVFYWEQGRRRISPEHVEKLRDVLGVELLPPDTMTVAGHEYRRQP